MFRTKRRPGKLSIFIVSFATLFLLFNAFAIAGGEGVGAGGYQGAHGGATGGVHEGSAESGHGADRRGDLLDLLYRFINFALLIIILFVAIKKSGLKDSLTGRIAEIKQNLEDLSKEKEAAEGKYQDIEKKLREFEEKKREIIEQFQKEGLAEKEKIIAEAKQRAKQIVDQAELTIEQEMQSAKDRLRKEVTALASQKAQEIIAKEMTDEDQDRLVNDFIERVGKIH